MELTSTNNYFKNKHLRKKSISTLFKKNIGYYLSGDKSIMGERIELKNIDIDELHLSFKEKYAVVVYYEDGYLFCDNDDFDIHAYGKTYSELLDNIYSDIAFVWNEIVKSDDSKLNNDAIKLKKKAEGLLIER